MKIAEITTYKEGGAYTHVIELVKGLKSETIIVTGNTKKEGFLIDSVEGKGFVQYEVDSLPLMPGTYLFSAAIYDFSGMHPYDHWEQYWKFNVLESKTVTHRYGLISMPSQWKIE